MNRSKQDSQHITGLKEEINLLKTFIMESYNNLTELRRAEESIETERRFQPMSGGNTYLGVQNPYRDDSTLSHNPMGGWEAYEPPIPRPPMPTSNACGSQSGDSSSDDGVDDNSDANSTNSQEQRDQGHPGSTGDTSNTERLIPGLPSGPRLPYDDVVKPRVHRESNLLLQIVPYKPISLYPGNSDRLILGGHGAASESKSTKGGATDSVRLLLEKWTTSGAAPVSDILDEEAAKEKKVVSVGESLIVFGFAKIVPVSWLKNVELQTLHSKRSGHYPQEPDMLEMISPMHIIRDCLNILVSNPIKCRHHLLHCMVHSQNPDILFTILRFHVGRIFGNNLIPLPNLQVVMLGMIY